MIYTEQTKKAMRLCFEVHKKQTDKSGTPYVFHPFHVAEQMKDEPTIVTALLHDVVEDSRYTLEKLRKLGFQEEVLEALRLLTHDKNTPYMYYISALKTNPIARAVKLADLQHNSDLSRLDSVTQKDLARHRKYRCAMALLEDDRYDSSMDYYVKRLPLDDERLCFFSICYREGGKVVSVSFDIEEADDEHYSLTGDAYRRLIKGINQDGLSEYEAITEAFYALGASGFASLLQSTYQAEHFVYYG